MTAAPAARAALARDVAALAASLLAYAFARGGLVLPNAAPALQVGALVGIVAAFAAASAPRAAAAAAVAGLVGGVLLPLSAGGGAALATGSGSLLAAATVAAVAAAIAGGARWLVDTGRTRRQLVVAIGIVLVLGNLWLTTATLAQDQVVLEGKTMLQFLTTRPQTGVKQPDQDFYNNVLFHMRDGQGYYSAFRLAYHEDLQFAADPPTITSVREPLLPEFLKSLPGDGRGAIWAMALLATSAALCAPLLLRNVDDPGVRLVPVIALSAYFLAFTTLPFVLGFEPWGGALGVVCAALFAVSQGAAGRPRRGFLIAAAAVAVLAFAVRELMAFLPVAGLVAAAFAEPEERRFEFAVWGAAVLGCVLVYAPHALAASHIVTSAPMRAVGFGGFANVLAATAHGAYYISKSRWLMAGLGVLGILGAALQREKRYRAFLLVATVLPMVAFFFAYNGAIDELTKLPINYWGATVAPLLFALAPASLGGLLGQWRLSGRPEAAPAGDEPVGA